MKFINPTLKLLFVFVVFYLVSCNDETNEIGSNLAVVPKQMLSANISIRGTIRLMPQMLMAQGGNPSDSYTWEIDTSFKAPERLRIGATDGIVTLEGASAEGFKAGTTYFRVMVSDGEYTSKGMVGLVITDYKVDPISVVQQLDAPGYQLMNGVLGEPYCASLFVMGGTPPYTFLMDSVYSSEIELYGLSLDPDYGLITGKIPKNAVPRVLSFRVEIEDSKGKTAIYNPDYKIRIR
jgi:hypothetical protein